MTDEPSKNQAPNGDTQGGSDAKPGAAGSAAPLLALKGLDKRFGATHALRAVDLVFEAGEVHAIVGEKGPRKSPPTNRPTASIPRWTGKFFGEARPAALAPPNEAIDSGTNGGLRKSCSAPI